ncbi:MAG: hypothetical protein BGO49_20260 [Planctomycetales bacterium 71-10]|nr:MAG: hypothetical protein BGO49_20260 [Planctomycetales bacterium 71-10]
MDYLKPTRPFEINLGIREPWAVSGLLWSYMHKEAADRLATIVLAQESGEARYEEALIRWEPVSDPVGPAEPAIKITIGPAASPGEEAGR